VDGEIGAGAIINSINRLDLTTADAASGLDLPCNAIAHGADGF
jgi:hypothetical protein